MDRIDFYISYGSKDISLAHDLKRFLLSLGKTAWMVPDDVPFGEKQFDAISDAFSRMDAFIVLLTETSIRSAWVMREISSAVSLKCRIIPVIFDGVMPDERQWFYLSRHQSIHVSSKDPNWASAIGPLIQAEGGTAQAVPVKEPPHSTESETFRKEQDVTVKPYDGKDPFIFISYSHQDTARVLPIIRRMQQDGYNVWYDEGIDPGTEWDNFIASRIEHCSHFIAMISKNFLDSDNCLDELALSRDLKIKRLLIYLEDITLPTALRMRHGRIQAVHHYSYHNNPEGFYNKLYQTREIEDCKSRN